MSHFILYLGVIVASGSLLASIYILVFAVGGMVLGKRSGANVDGIGNPVFVVLIPAHNEEQGIQATIESALALNYSRDRFRVVTIADNCDDQTAAVAAKCGSEVWVRTDPENRGKGQALSWAFERAFRSDFDLIAIIDADTEIDPNFLRAIAARATANPDPQIQAFQGRYEFKPSQSQAGWFETFTIASKAAENSFIYRPRSAAGLVTLIQGNGFCLPRAVLEQVPFEASSVVEDAEYAITLALAGVSVCYVDSAQVYSRMTKSIQDAAPQRLRWASGIFQLIWGSVPKLVRRGVVSRNWKLIEGAVMLLLTSRLTVLYLTVSALVAALLEFPSHAASVIGAILLGTVVLQVLYLLLMFRYASDKTFPITDLLFMPVYLGIIGVTQAGALLGFRRKRWARTVR
jgi:1,2-diacylglycerol 3-beta-glucosyltransferase